jgi:methionyl-tRNA formyltransferase
MIPPGPIVFFGTPTFAVPTLDALFAAGLSPALVVTQPARPVGRGRKVVEPPVARRARELDLPVALEASVSSEEFLDRLSKIDPWVGVVVAFGQIFPASLLDLPISGCINLHASLLPKYRGAAPIQAAIAAGDTVTGATTMRMDVGLDTGPILLQSQLDIGGRETAPELAERLASEGAGLVVETLEQLSQGDLVEIEQDRAAATLAPKLNRDDAEIDWRLTAREIYNRWRAYTPWPGLRTRLGGEMVKVRGCRPDDGIVEDTPPGTIITAGAELRVACGDGSVVALEALQRPNRSVLDAAAFVNGERLAAGDRFEMTVEKPL